MEEDLTTDLTVLQSHLESMIERIQQNSATLSKFQAFEMRLLNLNSLSEMIDHILEEAKLYFDLDVISLCLIDEKNEIHRFLVEDGYAGAADKGLILLDNRELLTATFGFAHRPYIGAYKSSKCDNFFLHVEDKPASVAITPLNRGGNYLGTLNLGSYNLGRFANNMATDFVEHLVSIVGVCLENNLNSETIKRTSFVDTLTGVNNRRFFEQRVGEELGRCQRNGDPISCLFMDIDFFKSVNDTHGHQVGDFVLARVANEIKSQLRNNDVLTRYGGEEFVVLLTNINDAKALEIAERIRKAIQSLANVFNDIAIPVTISIGSATYLPNTITGLNSSEVAQHLIKLSDAALYEAKNKGRNRVENGGLVSGGQTVLAP